MKYPLLAKMGASYANENLLENAWRVNTLATLAKTLNDKVALLRLRQESVELVHGAIPDENLSFKDKVALFQTRADANAASAAAMKKGSSTAVLSAVTAADAADDTARRTPTLARGITPAELAEIARLEGEVVALQAKLERDGVVFRTDGSGMINWNATAKKVRYYTPAERDATRLRAFGGLLYTDTARSRPLDTRGMESHFSGLGYAVYVMGQDGNLYASNHTRGYRHHSSFLAGGEVAGAGELAATGGRLTFVSNKSGHYCPAVAHLLQVLYQLDRSGVDLSAAKVRLHTTHGKEEFPSVSAFLTAMQSRGVDDFEYAKMLAYANSLPTKTIRDEAAKKGWHWVCMKTGTRQRMQMRDATGSPVSDRDARKWLKAIGASRIDQALQLA